MRTPAFVATAASLLCAAHALAQPFAIDWYTIESGGNSQGGAFKQDCVIGQPDAGPVSSGGLFSLTGGFLVGDVGSPHCPADVDNDGSFANGLSPDGGVDISDLLAFLGAFEAGNVGADIDNGMGNGTPDGGVDISDLLHFLSHFEAGC